MKTIPTHIRKAAVLLRSLDSDTSAQLLAQLSTEEVALVRTAVRSLHNVDDDERADVLTEFRQAGSAVSNDDSGVEIADSLLSLSQAEEAPTPDFQSDILHENQAFSFISEAEPEKLAPYLARQNSQTVAVIFSHLEAERAASLLAELPRNLQADVLQRISELGNTDEESLKIIKDDLAAWLGQQHGFVSKAERGDHAARILAATKPNVRDGLLSQIGQRNGQLADLLKRSLPTERSPVRMPAPKKHEPKTIFPVPRNRNMPLSQTPQRLFPEPKHQVKPPRPTIPFERLAELDISTLEAVLRSADPAMVRLALSGADDAMVTKVVGLLPKAVAKEFRQQLHQMGPTRLSDVAYAQKVLAESASKVISSAVAEHSSLPRTETPSQALVTYA